MKRLLTGFMVLFLLSTLSGCATLFDNDPRIVNVTTSTGERAEIQVRGVNSNGEATMSPQVLTAPGQFTVPTKRAGDLHLNVVGSDTEVVHPKKVAIGFWFNIIGFTGILGPLSSTTDAVNGNMWTYESSVVVPMP